MLYRRQFCAINNSAVWLDIDWPRRSIGRWTITGEILRKCICGFLDWWHCARDTTPSSDARSSDCASLQLLYLSLQFERYVEGAVSRSFAFAPANVRQLRTRLFAVIIGFVSEAVTMKTARHDTWKFRIDIDINLFSVSYLKDLKIWLVQINFKNDAQIYKQCQNYSILVGGVPLPATV